MRGAALCAALSAAADHWLADLLGGEQDVALVAVGGYGRSQLCPGSDLDVVLVHRGRGDINRVAEKIWYPIWDAGVKLDHSVRTVKEALAVAAEDGKAALGLLDARLIAGNGELAGELLYRARAQWRARAADRLVWLQEQLDERMAAFGEVAFLLEPELKEGRGGLRDAAALRAVAAAAPVIEPAPVAVLEAESDLVAVRTELHRRTGRTVDRLLLQEQDGVAEALGDADADALMARVAHAGRVLTWACDDALRRAISALRPPSRGFFRRQVERPLGTGLIERTGEVALTSDADPANDPALPLRAAAAAAHNGLPLSRAALLRLGAEVVAPPEPWPADLRDELVSVLGAGPAAIGVLEALDHHGILVRLLPEWQAVRSKPQRNAYHRFTVDRHLLEAAAGAAALIRRVARPDLLLIGTLLHDIGKGFPGDHTDVGVEVVGRIGPRLGFGPADAAVLVAMVRHHLLLADVATRRDIADPATAELVARAVGDESTLALLHALTEADSLATGPAAWSGWKAGLVSELVERSRQHLAGAPPRPPSEPPAEDLALLTAGRLAVKVEPPQVVVAAPDRHGLFSRVAGALALHGLDVRAADAWSRDGMALETFTVERSTGGAPDWERLTVDIERAVAGKLALEARLHERAKTYAPRRRVAPLPAKPLVLVDNEASATATVIEVRAPDGIGVLYKITRALADADLHVQVARINTLGHEVVDAFYVVDMAGEKVADAEHLAEVERAIIAALLSPPG